jgi:hypothetical protein
MAEVLANANRSLGLLYTKLSQLKTREVSNEAQAAMEHLNVAASRLQSILERIDGERGILTSVQRASDSVGDVAVNARGFGPEVGETMRDFREAADSVRRLADALELDSDMLLKGRSKAAEP